MAETERIVDQHERGFDGDPWYGLPLTKILSGLTAEAARARPIPNAHTIWEIVLHIAAWEGAVLKRLKTGSVSQPDEGDWPEVTESDEKTWQQTLTRLRQTHDKLSELLRQLQPKRLDDMLGAERDPATGGGHTVGGTVHGVIQHNVYHAGQIAILRKAIG